MQCLMNVLKIFYISLRLINDHKVEVRKFPFKRYQETFSAIYGFYLNFELFILRMDFLSHEVERVQGVKFWYNVPILPSNFTINASKVPFHANFMLLNDLQNTPNLQHCLFWKLNQGSYKTLKIARLLLGKTLIEKFRFFRVFGAEAHFWSIEWEKI